MNRATISARVQNLFDLWTHQEIWEFNKIARMTADRWYFVDGIDATASELGYSAGDCFRFESFQLAMYIRDAKVLFHFLDQSHDGKVTIWNPSLSQSHFLEFLIKENGLHSRVEIVGNGCKPAAKIRTSSRPGVVAKIKREWNRLIANTQTTVQKVAKARLLSSAAQREIQSARHTAANDSKIGQRPSNLVSNGMARVFSGADTIGTPRMSGLDEFGFETVHFGSRRDISEDKTKSQQNENAFAELVEKHRANTRAIVESSDYGKLFVGLPKWLATWWRQHVLLHFPPLAARLEGQSGCFRDFLVGEDISLLLMPMAWAGERRMQVSIANNMNIPTVCIQDGLLRAKNESAFSNPVPSQFQIAPGPDGVKWAESHGYKTKNLINSGQFLWDESPSVKNSIRGGPKTDSMDLLYLAPRRAFILDQPAWVIDRQIEWICNSIARNPGIRLFYKDHPRVVEFPGKKWQQEMHARIRSILGDQLVVLPQDKSPESCWASVDAVICYRSTTVFQAISAGVPLILVDFFAPSQDESPYSQINDEFPVLRTRKQLDDCLKKIRMKEIDLSDNQDAREKWLRRYFSPAGSIEKVAEQLKKIVAKNSTIRNRAKTKVA